MNKWIRTVALVLAILGATAARPQSAFAQIVQTVSADSALRSNIQSRLDSAAIVLARDGQRVLDSLITGAAARMRSAPSARLAEANVNAQRFGDQLVVISRREGSRTLTASDVRAASASLCPLWPIC